MYKHPAKMNIESMYLAYRMKEAPEVCHRKNNKPGIA
jgi:hypothetical protein